MRARCANPKKRQLTNSDGIGQNSDPERAMMRLKSSRPPGQAALTRSRRASSSGQRCRSRPTCASLPLCGCPGTPRSYARDHAENNSAVHVEEIRDGQLAAAIDRAVRGARRRLQRAECARVFDNFRDGNGRSLSDVLATMALSRTEPASRAIFRDGRANVRCRTSPAAAFTGPGSRVVFVCGNRFGTIGRERAELIIIHELLTHSGSGSSRRRPARSIGSSPGAAGRSRRARRGR